MDWPLKKIQGEIEKNRKRLAHRLDSNEDVPPYILFSLWLYIWFWIWTSCLNKVIKKPYCFNPKPSGPKRYLRSLTGDRTILNSLC
ncbi:hypothetical protein BpHYR1_051490 [Brachionus plicatilis]|uniref:Uncharacterized protein n=1 Tax=Brachionus plicatilis TaxID=10195 RepID=A0A3M7QJD2_BRAPC|nr:hypothetical protein BpHYR1_051490 [Brachionus plicatilis]